MLYITRTLPFNLGCFSRGLPRLNEGTSRRFCCCSCTPLRLHGVEKKTTKQNPPANKVKTTASRTLVYPTPMPPLSGPSRHISVMAPHRSRGLLVCTQCPLIGRNAKESRRTVSSPVARRSACAVCEIALFFCLICGERKHAPSRWRHPVFYHGTPRASIPLLCVLVIWPEAFNP